jgi:hypothetical protein
VAREEIPGPSGESISEEMVLKLNS